MLPSLASHSNSTEHDSARACIDILHTHLGQQYACHVHAADAVVRRFLYLQVPRAGIRHRAGPGVLRHNLECVQLPFPGRPLPPRAVRVHATTPPFAFDPNWRRKKEAYYDKTDADLTSILGMVDSAVADASTYNATTMLAELRNGPFPFCFKFTERFMRAASDGEWAVSQTTATPRGRDPYVFECTGDEGDNYTRGYRGGHAVELVGGGTTAGTNQDYWILKNSNGPEWGDGGYFYMARGSNTCGIETATCNYPRPAVSGCTTPHGIASLGIGGSLQYNNLGPGQCQCEDESGGACGAAHTATHACVDSRVECEKQCTTSTTDTGSCRGFAYADTLDIGGDYWNCTTSGKSTCILYAGGAETNVARSGNAEYSASGPSMMNNLDSDSGSTPKVVDQPDAFTCYKQNQPETITCNGHLNRRRRRTATGLQFSQYEELDVLPDPFKLVAGIAATEVPPQYTGFANRKKRKDGWRDVDCPGQIPTLRGIADMTEDYAAGIMYRLVTDWWDFPKGKTRSVEPAVV